MNSNHPNSGGFKTRTSRSSLGRSLMLSALVVALPSQTARALEIAVTNDDGWQSIGIQALFDELVAAGHTVTLAAPADQQSGSSAALNIGELRVTRMSDRQYAVSACRTTSCDSSDGGEPAVCALLGIDIATRRADGRKPDLLVSGINSGANTGGASQFSGTVGAAIAAASEALGAGVPAIAISTDEPASCSGDAECLEKHYRETARFLVRLVAALDARRNDGPLMPARTALNVNYPATPSPPKGIRVTSQSPWSSISGQPQAIRFSCEGCAAVAVGESVGTRIGRAPRAEARSDPPTDIDLFAEGYITVVPMQPSFTPGPAHAFDWLGAIKLQ
jgi:5'-nucleotidase